MDVKSLIYNQALKLKKIRCAREFKPEQFHASEAGDCARSLYFKHIGRDSERVEENSDEEARVEMLLDDGTYVHQSQITKYIMQAPGIHITNIEDNRVLFCDGFIISGHPDGVLYDPKSKERWILEVKGISTHRIGYRGKERLVDDDIETLKTVYPSAIPQARIYSKMYNTKGAVILVRNKDNAAIYQFILYRDEEAENRIIERFRKIHKACVDKKNGIACDFIKSDYRCKFCLYPGECGSGRG